MREDVAYIAGIIAKKRQSLKDNWRDLSDRLELERNKGKDEALEDLQRIFAKDYPEVFGKRTTSNKE